MTAAIQGRSSCSQHGYRRSQCVQTGFGNGQPPWLSWGLLCCVPLPGRKQRLISLPPANSMPDPAGRALPHARTGITKPIGRPATGINAMWKSPYPPARQLPALWCSGMSILTHGACRSPVRTANGPMRGIPKGNTCLNTCRFRKEQPVSGSPMRRAKSGISIWPNCGYTGKETFRPKCSSGSPATARPT